MKNLMYRTLSATSSMINRQRLMIDATDQIAGRLASRIAILLRGKHKACYTPNKDCGDCVVVTNVSKIQFTGKKKANKLYVSHTGYPGGQKKTTLRASKEKHPVRFFEKMVKGMLPKNKLARQMFKKLTLCAGDLYEKDKQKIEN